MFYQDLFNCVIAWWRSRRWWRMSLVAFLPLSLLLISCSLVVYGALLSRQTLATRYLTLIQDDLDTSFNELLDAEGSAKPAAQSASGKPETAEELDPAAAEAEDSGSAENSRVVSQGERNGVSAAAAQAQAAALARVDDRRVQVPMRRILQLGNFSPRVAYVVASQMAQQGRLGMAARMMRDIAPHKQKEGFAYAHAWLANYAMLNWKGTEAEAELLMGDLQAAEQGGVVLTVGQVRNYASLLIQSKRTQEALVVLRDYAPRYPELNVLLASLSKQTGHTGVQYQAALADGRQSFEAKREAGELEPQDWIQAVQIEMLDDVLDRALVLARAGFESDAQNPELRRLYSDVLLAKHHSLNTDMNALNETSPPLAESSSDDAEDDTEDAEDSAGPEELSPTLLPELRYLEAACHVDSSNPALVPEVAKAVALGQRLTPRLREALERSLVDGTASGITHLILANKKLTGESPETSLPHLRLALRQMPNSPVVMNNLAYALMKYAPDELDEAQQLMERALSIPGGTAQHRASMLDTLGEIRLTQGQTLAAIEMFEQAIELDGSKLGTRQHLVDAYQQANMPELSKAQQQRIEELSTPKE